jgi:hypothetical protein
MDDSRDFSKQLQLYADAITGFSMVQAVGFVLLAAHGDCFSRNITTQPWWVFWIGGVVNIIYLTLVYLCHRAQNRVDSWISHDHDNHGIVKTIQFIRIAIICIAGVCTILLPFGLVWGLTHGTHGMPAPSFHIDCKC